MSHHLDTPLAPERPAVHRRPLRVSRRGSTVFVMDVNSTVTGHTFSPASTLRAAMSSRCTSTAPTTKLSPTGSPSASRAPTGGRPCSCTPDRDAAREDAAAGELLLDGRTGEAVSEGDIRIWAGRIADSFYIDLSLLSHRQRGARRAPRPTCRRGGPRGAEQLRQHDRRVDRARGLPPPPAAAARRRGPASGARPSSPLTPAAGGRSTGPATR